MQVSISQYPGAKVKWKMHCYLLLRLASYKTIVIEYRVTICNNCLGETVLFRLVARVLVPPIIINSMNGQKHRFLTS